MKPNRIIAVATAILIAAAASNAVAQDARTALIQKIAVAQGLTEIFDEQLMQQREAIKAYAEKLFQEAAAARGGQANPKEEAAFKKFAGRVGEMFSGKEVASEWVKYYGKDLTLQELRAILNYYESPVGRKDVAATKSAMPAFSSWMAQEAQVRATALLKDFAADLQAASK